MGPTSCLSYAYFCASIFALVVYSGDSKKLSSLFRRSADSAERDDLNETGNLQNVLNDVVQDDGVVNPNKFLHNLMKDPLPINDFNVSVVNTAVNTRCQFRKMELHGLKNLQIKKMVVNLGQANASLTLHDPLLRLTGVYDLDGYAIFLPLSGNGDFTLNATNAVGLAEATLKKDEYGNLQVDEIKVELTVDHLDMKFENLMGSLEAFSNSLINQYSDTVFEKIRSSTLGELREAMRREINLRLEDIPEGMFQSNTSNVFDSLLERAAETIVDNDYEPLALPEYEDTFRRRAFFLDVYGQVKASNGTLHGLSTLQRTGDILAIYENDSIIFEASLGFRNLTGMYRWNAHFMGVGPMGTLSLSLTHTSIFMRIYQELRKGSKPKFLDLQLDRIGQVWIDVHGLGSLDFLLEIIINLITNALKHSIFQNAIIPPVRDSVQYQLENVADFL